MQFCTYLLVAAFLVFSASAQSPKHFWILQEPDSIVEYDITRFAPIRTIKMPHRLLEHPEYLSINNKGQMLFFPPQDVQWGGGEMSTTGHRVWLWDGQKSREWNLGVMQEHGKIAGKPTIIETKQQCFLSSGGKYLFWFENRFEKVMDKNGIEISVQTSSLGWQTDLAGKNPETIMSISFPELCQCGTGVCSETCPELYFWAPEGVVDDFFMVTRFIPGQLGTTYHESLLYQHVGQKWIEKKLSQPIEIPLDASQKGEILVAAIPDAGCCGWDNESSDQTMLLKKNDVSVIYDEFARYNNRDYDISFSTADARLSADNNMLAYNVVSTFGANDDIRLSSEGKKNTEELKHLRKIIGELPSVEIMRLENKPRVETTIPHASLVGWLNKNEILITYEGKLAVYDIKNKKRKETAISVRSAADVYIK